MKQWMSLVLAILMLFSCIPVGTMATEVTTDPTAPDLEDAVAMLEQPEIKLSNTADGIYAQWNSVADAESYLLYRRSCEDTWDLLIEGSGTDYLDRTAEEGVTYSYRVLAKNGETLSVGENISTIFRLPSPMVTVTNFKSGVSVQWNPVEGATSYHVYKKTPGGSWKSVKTGLTGLSYTDTAVEYGASYIYAVRSCDATGGSAYGPSAEIVRIMQPEAAVSNKSGGIRITWDSVVGAECYNVYRKVSGGSWKLLTAETGTLYEDADVRSGVTYTYRVRAKSGDTLSSNKHSVTILRLDRPTPTASNGNTGVVVKWNAVEGAESYRVNRKLPGGSWKLVANNIKDLTYTDTTAKSGTTYQYTVRALNGDAVSGNTSTPEIQYLSRPVVNASASTTSIKLQWKAVEGAKEYIVYVKNDAGNWESLKRVTGTSYIAKNLTLGQIYSFAVRAVNDQAQSTRSAAASAKATFPAPEYSVKLKSGKGIEISWKAVDGAGSYRVYRRTNSGSWKILKTTTATSYVDTTGKSGVTYEYAVRAFELKNAEGIYGPRATGKKAVFSKVDPKKPMVALTFDDGPSIYTKGILDQLEKYNAHATFFVVGERVSTYASTIKRAYSIGCEIGNHSWSHPNLASISVKSMQSEISRTDAAIEKVIGKKAALLRPPYGSVDSDVRRYAGKPLIHWSIDTLDWKTRNSSKTISSVLNNVRDGSIVLMHDIYSATRTAAVSLIPTLISRGYQLVTVSELAAYHRTNLKNGSVYYNLP